MARSYSEVVKIIEFGPYDVHKPKGAEPLKFRVEIISGREPRQFFARVYRRESFRIQPTFPQSKRVVQQLADVEILVLDDFLGADEIQGKTAHEVIEQIEDALKRMFGRVQPS